MDSVELEARAKTFLFIKFISINIFWYMARFFNSKQEKILTVTIEDSCQSLLKNYAGGCWRIVPVTVEQSCQQLLNNRASDCWKSCQRLLNNRASDCWIIVQATVEQPYQRLLNNRASDWWRIMPATVQQSCQRLLNDRASYSSTSKCPHDNVCKN